MHFSPSCLRKMLASADEGLPLSRAVCGCRGRGEGPAADEVKARRAPIPLRRPYQPSTYANTSGATMLASDSITKRGVSTPSLPQVIFSLGTAPEYDPYEVVLSLIWQK